MKKTLLIGIALLAIGALATTHANAAPPPPVAAKTKAAPVPAPAVPAKPVKTSATVEQLVNTGLTEYKQKNYGKAANALNKAAGQLRKLKSEALTRFLPAAPKGWTAKDKPNMMFSLATSAALGSKAERIYESGGEKVYLAINTDSPVLKSMRKINTAKALMKLMGYDYVFKKADPKKSYQKNKGTLYISDTLVLTVKGKTLTDQQAQGFFGLVDINKLKVEANK